MRYLFLCLENGGSAGKRPAACSLDDCVGTSTGRRTALCRHRHAVSGRGGQLGKRLQHVRFWEIEWPDVVKLRTASKACAISRLYRGRETPEEIKDLVHSVLASVVRWQKEAPVRWCRMLENRPEIVTRRDKGTAMDWFREKRVAVWGCGALGSLIAEHLARGGAAELRLCDTGLVSPGLLVRQNFGDADVNEAKAIALKRRVEAIAPSVKVTAKVENLLTALDTGDWDSEVDIVIDATASLSVRAKLEAALKGRERTIPIGSVMISGGAQRSGRGRCASDVRKWTLRRAKENRPLSHGSRLVDPLGAGILDERRQ